MTIKERYEKIIEYFSVNNPPLADTELNYHTSYELLVAVILSAQCTDKHVNIITPKFFKSFPNENELAKSNVESIFEHIRTCSYPNNKAKYLLGMAKMLKDTFKNKIPSDIEELQRLPGVGRKTANVVAAVIFNKPTMPVDTHVFRVSARIGLTINSKTPLETEKQLVKHIPEDKISIAHHWLILHGRYICKARKPDCENCKIKIWCKSFEKHNI